MAVMTSAGSTLALSAAAPATIDAAGFGALTYTTVGEITDLGEVGKEYNVVNHSPLGDRRIRKFKGSYNNGSMQIQMGRDVDDAGQTLLRAALDSDANYSFKLTLQNGRKMFFQAQTTAYKTSIGSVDQITSASTTIEVVSEIVEVA